MRTWAFPCIVSSVETLPIRFLFSSLKHLCDDCLKSSCTSINNRILSYRSVPLPVFNSLHQTRFRRTTDGWWSLIVKQTAVTASTVLSRSDTDWISSTAFPALPLPPCATHSKRLPRPPAAILLWRLYIECVVCCACNFFLLHPCRFHSTVRRLAAYCPFVVSRFIACACVVPVHLSVRRRRLSPKPMCDWQHLFQRQLDKQEQYQERVIADHSAAESIDDADRQRRRQQARHHQRWFERRWQRRQVSSANRLITMKRNSENMQCCAGSSQWWCVTNQANSIVHNSDTTLVDDTQKWPFNGLSALHDFFSCNAFPCECGKFCQACFRYELLTWYWQAITSTAYIIASDHLLLQSFT